ncbi:MAG: hypothetical protein JXI32_08945 [Deltaproteobacteria bacterium]|nr:hypothetical protein [Deltaproteobacteria bacterium]
MNESKDTLGENMQALRKRDPVLADRLRGHTIQPCWEAFPAGNGQMTARKVLGKGLVRHMHSRHNPEEEALRWAGLVPPQAEILVVLGFGLGYHVLALRRRGYSGLLIIVEADLGLFHLALRSVALGPVFGDPKTRLFVEEDAEIIRGCIGDLHPGALYCLPYPPATELYPDYYRSIRNMVEQHVFEHRLRETPALSRGIGELLRETVQ